MKEKKRGFTLVELVIVIAVIAILAGVMIAVFSNVVNKANESAKLQDEKQAEMNQKLDDIEQKLSNQNWLGREDFENELAQQIAKIEEGQIGQAEVEAAIKTAIEQYAGSDTALTEEQVQAIIERAMSGQLTQAQVETIVRKYTAEIDGGASASQIQKIVNAAMANQLTAPQVSQLMKELVKGDLTNLDTKLSTLVTDVKNLEIKIDDLSGKITSAMNDTVTRLNTRVGITGAKTVVEAVAAAKEIGIDLNTLEMGSIVWDETEDKFVDGTSSVNQWLFVKSGDTLSTVYSNYLQGAWSGELTTSTGLAVGENQDVNVTVETTDEKTVDVYTNGGILTVNAPNATVNHYGTAMMVNVNAVAKASYHLYGKIIGNIVLKSGRVVAEAGSSVSAIIADTADSAAIRIEVTVSAKVGSVAATAADVLTAENTTVSAAATVKVDTAVSFDTMNLFAGGLGTKESPYLIATAEQLASILRGTASEKIYYSLVNDITITKSISENDAWGDPINSGMAPLVFASLNGNGYSIKDESGDIGNLIPYTSNSEITDIKFFVLNSVVNYAQSMTSFENVMVSGNMTVDRNTGAFVTYANGNISFKNCRNEANITGTAGSGGYNAVFVGYAFPNGTLNLTFDNCINAGSLVCGKAAMFLGNNSANQGTVKIDIKNCTNIGTIRSTYIGAEYKWNHYVATGAHLNNTVILDGVTLDSATLSVSLSGGFYQGPNDTLNIVKNTDKTFTFTKSNDVNVAYYVVSVGVYTGLLDADGNDAGTDIFYATERIDSIGAESYVTALKYLSFVDDSDSNETVADNKAITIDGVQYYCISGERITLKGAVKAPSFVTVSSYDANGNLISSASLN